VKQFAFFFKALCLVFLFQLLALPTHADSQTASKMDSVEIGLITCTPHNEIYSLYGHTALRYHNLRSGDDLIFNYGVFNFEAPHFVIRFVLGKTDYELGISPYKPFCAYYKQWGCMVTEQVLNLTNEEKLRIATALSINMMPQNRVYRYNFFYDNCSTRPRDIIENNLSGKIIYEPRKDFEPSFREMIHELTAEHPWTALGNDLLLGLKADFKTNRREQEFLPLNLMYDFDHAQIYSNGEYRPLVKDQRVLVEAGIQMVDDTHLFRPLTCAILLLLGCLCLFYYEKTKKRRQVWPDVTLMALTGLAGCLLFVMFFSEHPTTSTNLQILLFNPAWLFFIPSVARRKATRYWTVLLVCMFLFLLGSFLQDYAEGMEFLALCLLTRYCSHIINDK